jgi:hypothetical protein
MMIGLMLMAVGIFRGRAIRLVDVDTWPHLAGGVHRPWCRQADHAPF